MALSVLFALLEPFLEPEPLNVPYAKQDTHPPNLLALATPVQQQLMK